MTTLMEWDGERAAILRQEPAASFDAAGQAYADGLLRACQDPIFRPFHACAMLTCLPPL